MASDEGVGTASTPPQAASQRSAPQRPAPQRPAPQRSALWIIALLALVGLVGGLLLSTVRTSQYRSIARVNVLNPPGSLAAEAELIQSGAIRTQAAALLGFTPDITVEPLGDEKILTITSVADSAIDAAQSATIVASVYKESQVGAAVQIIQPGEAPEAPFAPNRTNYMLIGSLIGAVAGLGALPLLEFGRRRMEAPAPPSIPPNLERLPSLPRPPSGLGQVSSSPDQVAASVAGTRPHTATPRNGRDEILIDLADEPIPPRHVEPAAVAAETVSFATGPEDESPTFEEPSFERVPASTTPLETAHVHATPLVGELRFAEDVPDDQVGDADAADHGPTEPIPVEPTVATRPSAERAPAESAPAKRPRAASASAKRARVEAARAERTRAEAAAVEPLPVEQPIVEPPIVEQLVPEFTELPSAAELETLVTAANARHAQALTDERERHEREQHALASRHQAQMRDLDLDHQEALAAAEAAHDREMKTLQVEMASLRKELRMTIVKLKRQASNDDNRVGDLEAQILTFETETQRLREQIETERLTHAQRLAEERGAADRALDNARLRFQEELRKHDDRQRQSLSNNRVEVDDELARYRAQQAEELEAAHRTYEDKLAAERHRVSVQLEVTQQRYEQELAQVATHDQQELARQAERHKATITALRTAQSEATSQIEELRTGLTRLRRELAHTRRQANEQRHEHQQELQSARDEMALARQESLTERERSTALRNDLLRLRAESNEKVDQALEERAGHLRELEASLDQQRAYADERIATVLAEAEDRARAGADREAELAATISRLRRQLEEPRIQSL